MPTSTKPRIVDDLISVILESNDHWWPRDYQRLAVVSRGWVGPIRRRLYACPQLRTFRACTLFARTLSENPYIRALVHGLDLRPVMRADDNPTLTEKDMASLRFILSLDGFKTVTIGGELAAQAERFLHMMPNTRSVTSLHVDGSDIEAHDGSLSCGPPASLEWNESIAFRFTKLRTLRLTNMQMTVLEPPMPYSLRISQLYFTDVTVCIGSIQNLCFESWDHVRSLHITASNTRDSDDFVRDLLECCESLESLHYEVTCSGAHGDIFEEDLPLSSLRRLRLFDVDVNPQTLAILSQTCPNLERISVLGRKVRLTAQDWASLVNSGSLSSLKTLQTSAGTFEPSSGFLRWSPRALQSLASSCKSRNVSLTCGA